MRSTKRLRDEALARMEALGIDPTPENYTLWYRYAEGANPALSTAVDALLASKHPITEADFAALVNGPNGPALSDSDLKRITEGVASDITTLTELIREIGTDTKNFDASLHLIADAGHFGPSEVKAEAMMALLMQACRRHMLKSAHVERQLAISHTRISRLQDELDQLEHESTTDALTGLRNRRYIDEHLAGTIEIASNRNLPISLVMADIDWFKNFNDEHGHQIGDQVLKFAAAALRASLRDEDVPCRFGGEEFVLILPGTSLCEAVLLAERIRRTVAEKVIVKRTTGEKLGRVTMSFGVAEWIQGMSADDLIARADEHLYASKEQGRNRVTPAPDEDHTVGDRNSNKVQRALQCA